MKKLEGLKTYCRIYAKNNLLALLIELLILIKEINLKKPKTSILFLNNLNTLKFKMKRIMKIMFK